MGRSHGAPRNPRCQGLVERFNSTFKTGILKRMLSAGYNVSLKTFDWYGMLHDQVQLHTHLPPCLSQPRLPLDVHREHPRLPLDCPRKPRVHQNVWRSHSVPAVAREASRLPGGAAPRSDGNGKLERRLCPQAGGDR